MFHPDLCSQSTAWPRWGVMWALAFAIYAGCKLLTWNTIAARNVPVGRQLGYLLAWPGMDAESFLSPAAMTESTPSTLEWAFASLKLALGGFVFLGAARWIPESHPYVMGWVGMIGLAFLLHFGAFHLLSCAWRRAGVDAPPLMNRPLVSVSAAEFWGHRWNTAFRDLTHRFLFRPLIGSVGSTAALLIGFGVSGLIHELVISIPAGGGYGGPTAYFVIQGVAICVERTALARHARLRTGWQGWLFTMACVLGPVPLLFPPPFVEGVIVPFMRAMGA